jgi:hypothetical protein
MLLFVTDKKLFKKDFKPQLFVAFKTNRLYTTQMTV